MATYLPKDTSPGSAYQEGGGLYALGLIHANHGGDIIDYLLSQLKNASNDVRLLNLGYRYIVKYVLKCNSWKLVWIEKNEEDYSYISRIILIVCGCDKELVSFPSRSLIDF